MDFYIKILIIIRTKRCFYTSLNLDYLNDVLHEEHEEDLEKEASPQNEEWDSGLTFTAKSSRKLNFFLI